MCSKAGGYSSRCKTAEYATRTNASVAAGNRRNVAGHSVWVTATGHFGLGARAWQFYKPSDYGRAGGQ